LRVAGVHGFWEKALTARSWRFVRTGETLGSRAVRNRGPVRLGPSADRAYADGGVSVPDFNIACSPARLVVSLASGRRLTLTPHTVDAIRQTPRAAGL